MAGVLTAECGTAPCLLVCGCWKPSPGSDPSDHSELAVPSLHPSLLSLSVLLGSSPHTTLAWPHQPEQYPIASLTFTFNINIAHSLERINLISLFCHSFKQYNTLLFNLFYMYQLSPCPLSLFSDSKGDKTAWPSPDLHCRVVSSGLLVVAPCVGTWSRLSQTLS